MTSSRNRLGTSVFAVLVIGGAASVPPSAHASDAPWATAVYEGAPPDGATLVTSHGKIARGAYTEARVAIGAADVPFNHVYYMVPHNTYEYDASRDDQASGITIMLNAGWRSIELDVEHRDDSGSNNDWVSHGDQYNQNTCGEGRDNTYLSGCLDDVKAWLKLNGDSLAVPIVIQLDTKGEYDTSDDLQGLSRQAVASLEEDNLITPHDIVRVLNTPKYRKSGPVIHSLRDAVAQRGWPTMSDMMSEGKVLILFTGHTQQYGAYIDDMPDDGSGNWIFPCPPMQELGDYVVDSAPRGYTNVQRSWIVCGNVVWGDHKHEVLNQAYASNQITLLWIDSSVAGYADIEEYSHAYKAVAHGAQFISRNPKDYTYRGDKETATANNRKHTFDDHLPLLGIRRSVPGYFLMSYDGGKYCVDNNNGASDGTDTHLFGCSLSNPNQQYVYTLEGQLRPRSATSSCHDIDGGDASGAGKQIHIWDCDGGATEKWELQPGSSSFVSHEDGRYGFGVGSGTVRGGTKIKTLHKKDLSRRGQFRLVTTTDWPIGQINW